MRNRNNLKVWAEKVAEWKAYDKSLIVSKNRKSKTKSTKLTKEKI